MGTRNTNGTVGSIIDQEPSRAEILRAVRSAANKRKRGADLIAQGSAELATWSKAASALGVTMAEVAEAAGCSREMLYYLQGEHGLAKKRSA